MKHGHRLAMIGDELFNRPLFLSHTKAATIVAALAGRLDVRALVDEVGGRSYDPAGMRDLVQQSREVNYALPLLSSFASGSGGTAQPSRGRPYAALDGIACIPVEGNLRHKWGLHPESGSTGYDGLLTKLEMSEADPDVRGQAFFIRSGGGAMMGLFELTDRIEELSERHGGKPKMAFIDGMGCSAAYMIASACDTVLTGPYDDVGSIGALCILADQSKKLADEGIDARVIRSKPGKALGGTGLDPLTDEVVAKYQQQIDEADAIFVGRVAKNRELSENAVHETNAGVYMGEQALATGLVDKVCYAREAWADFAKYVN